MDDLLLNSLYSSLLTFAAIAFSLLISLPRLRFWLKGEFDRRLSKGGMRGMEFFLFTYYISITEYLDFYAILYLLGALFILLAPVWTELQTVAYWIIVVATMALLVQIIVTVFPTLRRALTITRVT